MARPGFALFLGLLMALCFAFSGLPMLVRHPQTYWLLFSTGGFAIGTLAGWWLLDE